MSWKLDTTIPLLDTTHATLDGIYVPPLVVQLVETVFINREVISTLPVNYVLTEELHI